MRRKPMFPCEEGMHRKSGFPRVEKGRGMHRKPMFPCKEGMRRKPGFPRVENLGFLAT
jgi:hypothetical protein